MKIKMCILVDDKVFMYGDIVDIVLTKSGEHELESKKYFKGRKIKSINTDGVIVDSGHFIHWLYVKSITHCK